MKAISCLFAATLLCASEIATAPSVGFTVSAEGVLARVTGVAGALIVEPVEGENVAAAAYSGRLLLSLANGELRAGAATAPESQPARSVFGFTPGGGAGAAYAPETGLLQLFDGNWRTAHVEPAAFGGEVLAAALPDPEHIAALVARDGLRLVRVRIADSAIADDRPVHAEAEGPAALLPSGDILYTLGGEVIHRAASGREQSLGLTGIAGFSAMGSGWVQAAAESGVRYAIRIRTDVRVMELPEVSQ